MSWQPNWFSYISSADDEKKNLNDISGVSVLRKSLAAEKNQLTKKKFPYKKIESFFKIKILYYYRT